MSSVVFTNDPTACRNLPSALYVSACGFDHRPVHPSYLLGALAANVTLHTSNLSSYDTGTVEIDPFHPWAKVYIVYRNGASSISPAVRLERVLINAEVHVRGDYVPGALARQIGGHFGGAPALLTVAEYKKQLRERMLSLPLESVARLARYVYMHWARNDPGRTLFVRTVVSERLNQGPPVQVTTRDTEDPSSADLEEFLEYIRAASPAASMRTEPPDFKRYQAQLTQGYSGDDDHPRPSDSQGFNKIVALSGAKNALSPRAIQRVVAALAPNHRLLRIGDTLALDPPSWGLRELRIVRQTGGLMAEVLIVPINVDTPAGHYTSHESWWFTLVAMYMRAMELNVLKNADRVRFAERVIEIAGRARGLGLEPELKDSLMNALTMLVLYSAGVSATPSEREPIEGLNGLLTLTRPGDRVNSPPAVNMVIVMHTFDMLGRVASALAGIQQAVREARYLYVTEMAKNIQQQICDLHNQENFERDYSRGQSVRLAVQHICAQWKAHGHPGQPVILKDKFAITGAERKKLSKYDPALSRIAACCENGNSVWCVTRCRLGYEVVHAFGNTAFAVDGVAVPPFNVQTHGAIVSPAVPSDVALVARIAKECGAVFAGEVPDVEPTPEIIPGTGATVLSRADLPNRPTSEAERLARALGVGSAFRDAMGLVGTYSNNTEVLAHIVREMHLPICCLADINGLGGCAGGGNTATSRPILCACGKYTCVPCVEKRMPPAGQVFEITRTPCPHCRAHLQLPGRPPALTAPGKHYVCCGCGVVKRAPEVTGCNADNDTAFICEQCSQPDSFPALPDYDAMLRRCPGCLSITERRDGCPSIMCTCGCAWCFHCGVRFADLDAVHAHLLRDCGTYFPRDNEILPIAAQHLPPGRTPGEWERITSS